jgi:hypothetical protein
MLPEKAEHSLINIDRFRRSKMGTTTFYFEITLVPALAIRSYDCGEMNHE